MSDTTSNEIVIGCDNQAEAIRITRNGHDHTLVVNNHVHIQFCDEGCGCTCAGGNVDTPDTPDTPEDISGMTPVSEALTDGNYIRCDKLTENSDNQLIVAGVDYRGNHQSSAYVGWLAKLSRDYSYVKQAFFENAGFVEIQALKQLSDGRTFVIGRSIIDYKAKPIAALFDKELNLISSISYGLTNVMDCAVMDQSIYTASSTVSGLGVIAKISEDLSIQKAVSIPGEHTIAITIVPVGIDRLMVIGTTGVFLFDTELNLLKALDLKGKSGCYATVGDNGDIFMSLDGRYHCKLSSQLDIEASFLSNETVTNGFYANGLIHLTAQKNTGNQSNIYDTDVFTIQVDSNFNTTSVNRIKHKQNNDIEHLRDIRVLINGDIITGGESHLANSLLLMANENDIGSLDNQWVYSEDDVSLFQFKPVDMTASNINLSVETVQVSAEPFELEMSYR